MSAVIAFEGLTKKFGAVTALDGLTAEVAPGRITAFLGANGSGKTTSMRLLLGLSEPTSGPATIGGRRYAIAGAPDPGRRRGPRPGLPPPPQRAQPPAHRRRPGRRCPRTRVEEVLELVGLAEAADRRVSAATPSACVSDSPWRRPWSGTRRSWCSTSRSTGSTRTGITTMRGFLREFADEGGTVFLSSHLLAEVAHSADDAIIIDHGRLVTAGPVAGLVPEVATFIVGTRDADLLAVALRHRGATVDRQGARGTRGHRNRA